MTKPKPPTFFLNYFNDSKNPNTKAIPAIVMVIAIFAFLSNSSGNPLLTCSFDHLIINGKLTTVAIAGTKITANNGAIAT